MARGWGRNWYSRGGVIPPSSSNIQVSSGSAYWASLGTTAPGAAFSSSNLIATREQIAKAFGVPLAQLGFTTTTQGGDLPAAKEFAGLDFDTAIGEVYGIRQWKMDEHGRLRARNWTSAQPWRPGVNTAKCHADKKVYGVDQVIDPSGKGRKAIDARTVPDPDPYSYAISSSSSWSASPIAYHRGATRAPRYEITWNDGSTEVLTEIKFATTESEPHEAPDEDCVCGFYAYAEPSHEDARLPRGSQLVQGIVRGSGRTLIGTKGFRCEKAEIIALLDPTRGGKKTADWRLEQRGKLERIYPDVPLLASHAELVEFAPLESLLPDPSTDAFWEL